jgi:large subunit ribosomal protein L29
MTKVRELRDMGEEQIRLVWKDAAESLFKLRIQAQTEKLASPSEARKLRRTIARCQTILTQRGLLQNRPPRTVAHATTAGVDGVPGGRSGSDEGSPQRDKHAKKHPASGRAKVREPGKAGVEAKRKFKKQSQSGT